jgi:hypothetical protein
MDILNSSTIPDGYMETKNGRPQQQERGCFLLGQPDVIKGTQDRNKASMSVRIRT